MNPCHLCIIMLRAYFHKFSIHYYDPMCCVPTESGDQTEDDSVPGDPKPQYIPVGETGPGHGGGPPPHTPRMAAILRSLPWQNGVPGQVGARSRSEIF